MLFIHGILGAAFKTWRQKDRNVLEEGKEEESKDDYTECWPKVRIPPYSSNYPWVLWHTMPFHLRETKCIVYSVLINIEDVNYLCCDSNCVSFIDSHGWLPIVQIWEYCQWSMTVTSVTGWPNVLLKIRGEESAVFLNVHWCLSIGYYKALCVLDFNNFD